ncbi:PIN domain-containing protein [Euhalothece natronophila Z-M001]|uniref:PIN domain-containing protein n=1 Tax=Euhalothece natronophila Z-M001 TaxID=522448 RepID=A0A5B8NN98_9CHRO|nr:PIN domain-containing protein [Euhalothece natronophila]QDZ40514.1 PIN domain-containing protein [Euhalothece natronophila Z-M001]
MPVNIFLDTNIIIYVYSRDEPDKQKRAFECIQVGKPWISTQVLNETINTLRRKFKLDYAQIKLVVEELSQRLEVAIVSTTTIQNSLAIAERYQYSYFDSLIIASALEMKCDYLYSEDLQAGQNINDQLKIVNPFVTRE